MWCVNKCMPLPPLLPWCRSRLSSSAASELGWLATTVSPSASNCFRAFALQLPAASAAALENRFCTAGAYFSEPLHHAALFPLLQSCLTPCYTLQQCCRDPH